MNMTSLDPIALLLTAAIIVVVFFKPRRSSAVYTTGPAKGPKRMDSTVTIYICTEHVGRCTLSERQW